VRMNWSAFLNRTERVHQDFLAESIRQRLFVDPRSAAPDGQSQSQE